MTEEQGQTAWVTPVYDAAGNMTTIPLASDPTVAQTAVYDAWNRLVQVSQGEDVVATYEYDALGRRTVAGRDTSAPGDPDGTLDTFEHYLYGGVQVLETRTASAADAQAETLQPHVQYVRSARYVDAAVLRDENTDADGACDDDRGLLPHRRQLQRHRVGRRLGHRAGALRLRPLRPRHDLRRRLVRRPQRVGRAEQPGSTPAASWTGPPGCTTTVPRWYDTRTGQFTTRDPLGFAAGDSNLYRYVGNGPVGSTDPSGLEDWSDERDLYNSGGGSPGDYRWSPYDDQESPYNRGVTPLPPTDVTGLPHTDTPVVPGPPMTPYSN